MTLTSNRLGRQLESISMPNARPLSPRISNFTEPFWLQLSDGVFNVVRCCNCERLHFPRVSNVLPVALTKLAGNQLVVKLRFIAAQRFTLPPQFSQTKFHTQ